MEDESNNSVVETALSNDDILAQLEASLDIPEASDYSEQADAHVEQEPVSDETDAETPDTEEQYFDINGENIALSELRSGYLRQADYTKKTQEIAEQRKAYQQAQFDKNQLRQEALQGIELLKQQMAIEFRQMEQPDWDYLVENDPAEFQRLKYIWEKREGVVRQMYEAEMALRQQAEAYEREQHTLALEASQTRLMEKYPELRNRETAQKALSEMDALLADYRFTKEDVNGLSDDRIISLIYDYVKLRNAQKAIPMVVQKMEQKPVISAKQPSSKTSDAYTRDFNKFNKSRDGKDAIALISRLL